MRKAYLSIFFLLAAYTAQAALNIQLHYDFGKDRDYVTSTIENFTPDKYGSTFFFVDMDYNAGKQNGVSNAYWEIARGIKFNATSPFEAHVEYNGGFGQYPVPGGAGAYTIDNAYLLGANYNWNSADFSKIVSLQGMYKYIDGSHQNSFQLTAVWDLTYFSGKFTFRGFADFWKEKKTVFTTNGNAEESTFVFLTEPQLWYNFTKQIALGSEIEIGNNFGSVAGFRVNPTVAAKYIF